MPKAVKIWFKKQVRIDHLTIPQRSMLDIGTVGLAGVKNRVTSSLGPDDAAAKPLNKKYAIQKTKLGLGNRRNLSFTGSMLRNLSIRTVSDNKAVAGLTGRKQRIAARANQAKQAWLVFSPRNRAAVVEATRRVMSTLSNTWVKARNNSGN
jgi:hypothetical protein